MNTETFIGTLPGPFSAGIVSQPHPGPPLGPGSRSNTPVVSAPPLQPIPHFPPIAGRGTPLAPPIQAFQLRPPSSQSSDVRRAQSAQLLPLDASHRGQALTARAQFAPGEVVDIMILPCSLQEGKRLFNQGPFAVSEAEKQTLFTLLRDHGCVVTVTLDENAPLRPLLDQHIRQQCERHRFTLLSSQSTWTLPGLRILQGTKLQFVQASSQTLINPASSLTSIKRMYAKLQGAFAPDRVVIPVVPANGAVYAPITALVAHDHLSPDHERPHRCFSARFFALVRPSSHASGVIDTFCTENDCLSAFSSLPSDSGSIIAHNTTTSPHTTTSSASLLPPIVPVLPSRPNTADYAAPHVSVNVPAPHPVQPFLPLLNRANSRTPTLIAPAQSLQSSPQSMAIDPQLLALPPSTLPIFAPPTMLAPQPPVPSRRSSPSPDRHVEHRPMPFPDLGALYFPSDRTVPVVGLRRSRSESMDELSTSSAPALNRQRLVQVVDDTNSERRVLSVSATATDWQASLLQPVRPDASMALNFREAFARACSVTWERDGGEPQVYIVAPNVKFASRAVITHLAHQFWIKYGRTPPVGVYNAPYRTEVDDVPLSAYLNPLIRGINIGPAVGRGPEVATLLEIIKTLVKSHEENEKDNAEFEHPLRLLSQPIPMPWGLWEVRHEFLVPTLEDFTAGNRHLEDQRMAIISAHGLVTALVMGHHLRAPRPIHPLVILWAILGDRAFEMSLELLEQFDRDAAEELRPWFALGPVDPLPSGARHLAHPVWSLFMSRLGIQSPRIGFTPDSSMRLECTRQLISAVVLGKVTTNALELQAFRQGFNLELATNDALGGDLRQLTELFSRPVAVSGDRTVALDPVVIIRTLYNRTVDQPQDVARIISFEFTLGGLPNSERTLYERIFKFRLLRWLHGHGHPDHHLVRDTLLMDHEYGDPTTLRARLLLQAVTECQDLPVDPGWRIEFRFKHAHVRDSREPVLDLHTCAGYCVIEINSWLRNALLEESEFGDPSAVTLFDCWLHEQVLHNQRDHSTV